MGARTLENVAKKLESADIHQQLKASGVAQVIVVLKPAGAAAVVTDKPPDPSAVFSLKDMERHFTSSERSQNSAILRAGATTTVSGRMAAARVGRRRISNLSSEDDVAEPVQYYPNLGVLLGTVTAQGLASLKADDRVAAVGGAPQFSLIRPERVAEGKLAARITWGIEFLLADKLWAQGLSGKGVRVAHLDTGVDGSHPAFKKAIAAFADFDRLGRLVSPTPQPYDSDQHGTHTAGTIAGREVQGKAFGVAPGAELASALVIEGGNAAARVLGGLDWALAQGVRVLSMSLGFRGYWEDFIPITQILRTRDVLPVIATGNEGPGTSRSPGNYAEVLSVGAMDEDGKVAHFSSSQEFQRQRDPIVPDLVAPGVGILSAKPEGGYQLMDGTSMATPHIAGLAALLFEAKPTATVDDVETAILNSCRLLPGMSHERANHGVPDATEALALLTGVSPTAGRPKKRATVKIAQKSKTTGTAGKR